MNRRQRKKRRVGEFTEYGFEVACRLTRGIEDADAFDAVCDVLDARGLRVGGGCDIDGVVGLFCSRDGRASATEYDRATARTVITALDGVADVDVGPLVDAWR